MVRELTTLETRLARLLTERKQAERRLAAERAVSRILAVSGTLQEAALPIVRAFCEGLDWDVGTLWVVDPNAELLKCLALWQAPQVEAPAFERDTRQRTFSPGVGGWVSESLVWALDGPAVTDLPRALMAAREGLHGAVGFLIRNGTGSLGIMEFFSRESRPPNTELIDMMTSICGQISQFIERRQAEKELLKQEEEGRIARQMQQGLLPRAMPRLAGFKISGKSSAANHVGGDCFDFIPLLVENQECLGILVADASGHGVGAALLVAQTRAYLRALSLTCADVGALLALSNQRLASDIVTDDFVTALLVRLDPRSRSLHYASAGHCAGYILDQQGQTRAKLPSTGVPLGIDPAGEFPTPPGIPLEPGDLALLFTDGVVEAASPAGNLFGLERTLGVVRAHQHEAPEAILEALFVAVNHFGTRRCRGRRGGPTGCARTTPGRTSATGPSRPATPTRCAGPAGSPG